MTEPTATNATLIYRKELSPSHIIIRVAPDWPIPDFLPGQFTALGLFDDFIKRSYSITTPPTEKGYLEFFLNHIESGKFTSRLFELQPGDRLWMDPRIEGHLSLEQVPPSSPLLLLATGTGLGPFMSMIRSNLLPSRAKSITLVHSVRHPEELGYQRELIDLANDIPDFRYLPTVTRAEESMANWSGLRLRIPELWKQLMSEATEPFSPPHTHIFLCGNPTMIHDMLAQLEHQGFKRFHPRHGGNIHVEKYW